MPDLEKEQIQFEHFMKVTGCVFESPIYQDKPDVYAFRGGYKCGIEITEGGPEEFHRARVIARKKGMTSFSSSSLKDNPKDRKRKNTDLENVISEDHFVNAEISAVSWANRIAQRILRKATLLKGGEIENFDQNWLVVIDDVSAIDALNNEFYRVALMASLGSEHLNEPGFDFTYVVCLRDIFVIDKDQVRGVRRQVSKDC